MGKQVNFVPGTLVRRRASLEGEIVRPFLCHYSPFDKGTEEWISDLADLEAMVAQGYPSASMARYAVVLVNGVEAKDLSVVPDYNARIEIIIRVEGGAANKVIRTVIQIAVTVAVFVVTGNPQLALTIGNTVGAALGALIANAIAPPIQPNSGNINDSPTYSLEGIRNSARLWQPLPLPLGRHRMVPDLMAPPYQRIVGDETYLRMLFCWGVGTFQLEDEKFGDTPVMEFDGVRVQHSLSPDAALPTIYNGLPKITTLDVELSTAWETRRTANDAEEIEVMLYFPQGLGSRDKKNKPVNETIVIEVEFEAVGVDMDRVRDFGEDPSEADEIAVQIGELNRRGGFINGIYANRLEEYFDQRVLSGSGSVALRRTYSRSDLKPFPASIRFAVPPGAQYDVHVRRTASDDNDVETADKVNWTQLNTWRDGHPVPDKRFAVTAIEVKASGELSGIIDNYNAIIQPLIPSYNDPGSTELAVTESWEGLHPSRNNADIARYAMTGPHAAQQTPFEEIDPVVMARFWEWCDANEYNFDYLLTSNMRRGELLNLIGTAARSRFLREEGQVRTVIDGLQEMGPRSVLSPVNAADFRIDRVFPPEVHAFRVTFPDAEDDWRTVEELVYLGDWTAETATLFETLEIPGITHRQTIFDHARFYGRSAEFLTLSGSCIQDAEHMLCKVGDRVSVQHETIDKTTLSSRIEDLLLDSEGRVKGIVLRDDATFEVGESYVVRWRSAGTDDNNLPYRSAELLVGVTAPPFTGADPIDTKIITWLDRFDRYDRPAVGDVIIFGKLGMESIDAVVKSIEPARNFSALIRWTIYAPERFDLDGNDLPDRPPVGTLPFVESIPRPIIVGANATDDGISIGFDVVASPEPISAIEWDVKRSGVATAVLPWESQSSVPVSAGTVSFPALRPGDEISARLFAVSESGRRSPAAIIEGIRADGSVEIPDQFTATAEVLTGESGSQHAVVNLAIVDGDPVYLQGVEYEATEAGLDNWFPVGTAGPSNPARQVTGLRPGGVYDFRAGWISLRGAETPIADRPVVSGVSIPAVLVSSDTASVGGRAVQTLLSDLDLKQTASQVEAITAARVSQLQTALEDADEILEGEIDDLNDALNEAAGDFNSVGERLTQFKGALDGSLVNLEALEVKAERLEVAAIPDGIRADAQGDLKIVINALEPTHSEGDQPGEVYISGSFDHPTLGAIDGIGEPVLTPYENTTESPPGDLVFMVYTVEAAGTRWEDADREDGHIVAAIYQDGVWLLTLNTSAAVPFIPRPDDVLLFAVVKTKETLDLSGVRPLLTNTKAVNARFAAQKVVNDETVSQLDILEIETARPLAELPPGILPISATSSIVKANAVTATELNSGEVFVGAGDAIHPTLGKISIDEGVVYTGWEGDALDDYPDNDEGLFYLLWSEEEVRSRFADVYTASRVYQKHMINIAYVNNKWQIFDNSGIGSDFSIRETDALFAVGSRVEGDLGLGYVTAPPTRDALTAARAARLVRVTDNNAAKLESLSFQAEGFSAELDDLDEVSDELAQSIESLQVQTTGARVDVPAGIDVALGTNCKVLANHTSLAVQNPGEVWVTAGSMINQFGDSVSIAAGVVYTGWEGDSYPPGGVFYLLWSAQDVEARFPNATQAGSFHRNLIGISHDGESWLVHGNGVAGNAFNPVASDVLFAVGSRVEGDVGLGFVSAPPSQETLTAASVSRLRRVSEGQASSLTALGVRTGDLESDYEDLVDITEDQGLAVQSLESRFGNTIPDGIAVGMVSDAIISPNMISATAANDGEIYVRPGSWVLSDGTSVDLDGSRILTAMEGATFFAPYQDNRFYLMFSEQAVDDRFDYSFSGHDYIIAVQHDGTNWRWLHNGTRTGVVFNPVGSDRIIATAQKKVGPSIITNFGIFLNLESRDLFALAELNARTQIIQRTAVDAAERTASANIFAEASVGDANTAILNLLARKEDGTTYTSAYLRADQIGIEGGGALFLLADSAATLSAPLIIPSKNDTNKVILGSDFGAGSDLVLWSGAANIDITQCRVSNAKWAFDSDGGFFVNGAPFGAGANDGSAAGVSEVVVVLDPANGTEADISLSTTRGVVQTEFTNSDMPSWGSGAGNYTAPKSRLVLEVRVNNGSWQEIKDSGIVTGTVSHYSIPRYYEDYSFDVSSGGGRFGSSETSYTHERRAALSIFLDKEDYGKNNEYGPGDKVEFRARALSLSGSGVQKTNVSYLEIAP